MNSCNMPLFPTEGDLVNVGLSNGQGGGGVHYKSGIDTSSRVGSYEGDSLHGNDGTVVELVGSGSDSDGGPQPKYGKKTRGRVKIKMQFISDKLRRYTTFSKRKTGIMKKVGDFSHYKNFYIFSFKSKNKSKCQCVIHIILRI